MKKKTQQTNESRSVKKQLGILLILLLLLGLIATLIIALPPNSPKTQWEKTLSQVLQRAEYSGIKKARSYLLDQDKCVPISELLYEEFLYSGIGSGFNKDKNIDVRVRLACKAELEENPTDQTITINLLGTGLRVNNEKTFDEYLKKHNVIVSLHTAEANGNEEARFILGWLDRHGYLQGEDRMLDLWLPFLQSNNSRLMSVIGVMLSRPRTLDHTTMSPDIGQKYLPIDMYENLFDNNRKEKLTQQDWQKKGIHLQLALLFFEQAYKIAQDFLAGKEIASMSFYGKGMGEMDEERSFRIYSVLANHDVPGINATLGTFYLSAHPLLGENIENLEKNDATAISYFEKGVVNHSSSAIGMLAAIYLNENSKYYDMPHGRLLFCSLKPKYRENFRLKDGKLIQIECR